MGELTISQIGTFRDGKIPLRIICRNAKQPYLSRNREDILELLVEGFAFYEKYFEYEMPFEKFDLIFCPDLAFSGMENPGAVLIKEDYLYF